MTLGSRLLFSCSRSDNLWADTLAMNGNDSHGPEPVYFSYYATTQTLAYVEKRESEKDRLEWQHRVVAWGATCGLLFGRRRAGAGAASGTRTDTRKEKR